MGRLFGTDGIRGVANLELTAELAFKVGQAGAYVLTGEVHHKPKILVGKDTRISGDMLEAALISGICSVGAEAVSIGIIPTPAVAYLVRKYNADAGVVISASHNPMEYNGIKYFNSKGYKLSDEIEERIEAIILDNSEQIPLPTGNEIGYQTHSEDAFKDYIEFTKTTIDCDLKGLNIVVDCANGASYITAPETFKQLGAYTSIINNKPDGTNINLNCGSTHMEELQKSVKQLGADIGLAFDGDADRVLAVDEEGNIVDGDQIMTICAIDLIQKGRLKKSTLVATIMSNMGLFIAAEEKGFNVIQAKVGDRYVLEEMLRNDYIIGGEQSGHIIFSEYNTTGDGLITALQLLSIMKQTGKKLSELASAMEVLPQVLVNAKVNNGNKNDYMNDTVIVSAIKNVQELFKQKGRVLIRPSGTEPIIRVMIEGQNKKVLQEKAEELARLIEKRLA
jgi:phosphoglucosamine mutase